MTSVNIFTLSSRIGPLPITSICTTTITAVWGDWSFGFIIRSLNMFRHSTLPSRKYTAVSVRWVTTRASNLFLLPSITVRHTILTLSNWVEYVRNAPWSVCRTWTTGCSTFLSKDQERSVMDWTKLFVSLRQLAEGTIVSINTPSSSGKSSGCWRTCLTKARVLANSSRFQTDGFDWTLSQRSPSLKKNSLISLALSASFLLESFVTAAPLASLGSFQLCAFKVEGVMLHRISTEINVEEKWVTTMALAPQHISRYPLIKTLHDLHKSSPYEVYNNTAWG